MIPGDRISAFCQAPRMRTLGAFGKPSRVSDSQESELGRHSNQQNESEAGDHEDVFDDRYRLVWLFRGVASAELKCDQSSWQHFLAQRQLGVGSTTVLFKGSSQCGRRTVFCAGHGQSLPMNWRRAKKNGGDPKQITR